MNRVVNVLGSLLVCMGLAILAYVGVTYAESLKTAQSVPAWTPAQQHAGRALARSLSGKHPSRPVHRATKQQFPADEPAVRMVIPKIAVDAPVVQTAPVSGVWEVADWAVGHLTTTPNPGALGNAAYAAHDDIKGEIFKRIDELSPGDDIMLVTRHAIYHYSVVAQQSVDPSDVSVLAPTKNSSLTLVSCAPYWVDTQRLIIHAVLKSRALR